MIKKAKSRKAKRRRGLLHHGLDRHRLKYAHGDLENAFAEEWARENNGNYGNEILQMLMLRHDKRGYASHYAFSITQRDAVITATAMQWLGTNCGFAFLLNALEKCGYRIARRTPRPPKAKKLPERMIKIDRRLGKGVK